jgi:hypothetical protein
MKLAGIISVIGIALLTGCASQQAPSQSPQNTASAEEGVDSDFVLPADYGRPGSMQVDWQPTAAPPEKKAKARKMDAKPHFVSTKKRSLFALPVTRGH